MRFEDIKALFDTIEEARKPVDTSKMSHVDAFDHHLTQALSHLEKHAKERKKAKDRDGEEGAYDMYRKIAKAREEY